MNANQALLFYRPRAILSLDYADVPGMDVFSAYLRLYSIVSPVDSTNTIQTPFRMENIFPLPPLRPISRTYEQLCDARACELLTRAEALDEPLYVSYSGGIDSTLVLVSLLKNASQAQKDRIIVLLSAESITENPRFYHEHILGNVQVMPGMRLPLLMGGAGIFTSGELNDQLFGSDIVASLISMHGTQIIHAPYDSATIVKLFNHSIRNEEIARNVVRTLEKVKGAAPVPLETNYDGLWWFNFAMKWQSVYLRALSFVHPSRAHLITKEYAQHHLAPFFGTDEFRQWSMNNRDKKIKDSWSSYKWLCKDIIYAYNGDRDYRDHKLKKGSLSHLVRQQNMHNFLDDHWRLLIDLDATSFINTANDFIVS